MLLHATYATPPGSSSSITPQADVYRPLRLPVILVGDGRLGGISCTLSAFESLVIRGYDVKAVVVVEGSRQDGAPLDNAPAIRAVLKKARADAPPVFALPPLPVDSQVPLDDWYLSSEKVFQAVWQELQEGHRSRMNRLTELVDKAGKHFWYPFTQHKDLGNDQLTVIDSAYGDHYTGVKGGRTETLYDACASWWTQVCGPISLG